MKAQDIVNLLSKTIPKYTAAFSNSVNIDSIIPSGSTATVTTAVAHNMTDGQNIAILGADAPVQIASLSRVTTFATIETVQDHDLTLSERDKINGGKTVTLSGATESEFNGTFSLLEVTNRRKIIIAVADSGATSISGSPLIDDANGGIFNGLFAIFNVTSITFDYTLPVTYTLPAAGSAVAQASIRVGMVLDINQYLTDSYTASPVGEDHLIVQLGDVTRSKNKNETSDASDSSVSEYSYTPTFIQTFAVYIIQNMTNTLGGAEARDLVESVYIPALFKALERVKLDTGFAFSQYRTTCTEHGVFHFGVEESKGKALYIHEVVFEQLAVLDKVSDTVAPDDDVAMRDVDYTISSDLGTGTLTANVDLDKEPI